MPMDPFHLLVPEIGGSEYRRVIVPPGKTIPPGEYGFVEAYCTEKGCNCRNVLLNVQSHRPPHHEATINFAIDPKEFDREKLPRAFLDPLNPQGPHADEILRLFQEVLLADEAYVARLARHRALVKEVVNRGPQRLSGISSRRA
jgi:hypothetical protein